MVSRVTCLLLGIWLMAAPDFLLVSKIIANNDHIVGPLVITFSLISMSQSTDKLIFINLLLGAWLFIGPWILGYESTAGIINDLIVGGLLVLSTLSAKGIRTHQFGGGWKSLVD